MQDTERIVSVFESLDVENIYIYVGDAVRFDYFDSKIRNQGTSIKTIASSTHSPSSFATLATGCYPPRHGVQSFTQSIPSAIDTVFDIDGVKTAFINSIFEYATEEHGKYVDPIYDVLRQTPDEDQRQVGEIDSPFLVMERGPGGHAPYGDFDGTASEYFSKVSAASRDRIEQDYRRSIEKDTELFERRIRSLADRGILNDTLVVYTSDHGELLGEGGLLGHNGPMSPELVYVPTCFIHPDIPTVDLQTTFHHADLLPTILDVTRNQTHFDGRDGVPLAETQKTARPCFWSNEFFTDRLPLVSGRLSYEGVWERDGGWVFSDTTRTDRLAVLLGKMVTSSKRAYMRQHSAECLRSYWWQDRTYGSPQITRKQARDILAEANSDPGNANAVELTEDAQKHLQDLGYLN